MDKRLTQAKAWVTDQIGPHQFTPLAGDASFRRYFRIKNVNDRYVLMDAPPDKEDTQPFVRIAESFQQLGVRVPQILFQDLSQGFLLLEDFGDRLYLSQLNDHTVADLYHKAFTPLSLIQSGAPSSLSLFDAAFMEMECQRIQEWYLPYVLHRPLGPAQALVLADAFDWVIQEVSRQPYTTIHRDFHSRNLLLLPDGQVGVIDFQDAMWGPVTYDLVSLLRDCYISWPEEKVKEWVLNYREIALSQGLLPAVNQKQFLHWFDMTSLQRHLKIVGIFARLAIRDGKTSYLNDIPQANAYIDQICARTSRLQAFWKLWKSWHRTTV